MSDLIDRISGQTTRPKIAIHYYMALQRLYALGEVTRLEVADELDFQGDEATQAGQLADKIDGETGIADKSIYILRVESVCMAIETHEDGIYHNQDGTIDKTKVYADLLITG